MGDLTRFQHQVLNFAQLKEQEEKEKKREEMKEEYSNGASGHQPNSKAGSGGGSVGSSIEQEETIRYVNQEVNPNHEIHDSN